jgi:hypothetical protein
MVPFGASQVGFSVKGAIVAQQPTLLSETPKDWPEWSKPTQRRVVALLGAAQRLAECLAHEQPELEARATFDQAVAGVKGAQLSPFDRDAILRVTREISEGHTKHDFETCSRCQLVVLESFVYSERHEIGVIKIPAKLLREALARVR